MQKVFGKIFADRPEIESLQGVYYFGGFWVRLWARLIDLMAGAVLIPLFIFLVLTIGALFGKVELGKFFIMDITYLSLAVWLSYTFYFVLLNCTWGKTVGKAAMKLKVVNLQGKKPGIGQSIYRETIGRFLCGVLLGIGYLPVLFTRQKITTADFLSDTRVVYSIGSPVHRMVEEEQSTINHYIQF